MRSARPLAAALLFLVLPLVTTAGDELAEGFRQPPPDARPQTWWHWMNGNISQEGITADLEAMRRVGLGGVQIFNATQGEPAGPVRVFGPEWLQLMQHAVAEADRLGLEVAMHNCAGWTTSGGPWVAPAQAMQQLVWAEVRVSGGQHLSMTLPRPAKVVADYCADVAVLAFPAVPGETQPVASTLARATSSTPNVDVRPLLIGTTRTALELPPPTEAQPQVITVEFQTPQTLGSVRLVGREYRSMPLNATIEASDDGRIFRLVAAVPKLAPGRRHPWALVRFPETSARYFRLTMTKVDARAKMLALMAIDFGGTRLPRTEDRAAFRADATGGFVGTDVPPSATIAAPAIVDLTANMKDGQLEWDAPPGAWTIVRFCHTPTGETNSPAPEGTSGWEADKMSRAAMGAHFDALLGRVIDAVGPRAGTAFTGVLVDSWEAGTQNWTPAFRAEFRQRRGYDLLPFLPVITGRVVGSVEQSERFLWDFRRTIGDLIAENHYGELRQRAAAHGMKLIAEAPGIGMPTVADQLECKGRTDVPMGEFWFDGREDTKETSSAAHVYGQHVAAAEAFTALTADAKWEKAPIDFKQLGDLQFTRGINQFVFHRYAHQPWLDRVPGMAMGPWGSNLERTNTWWEQGRAWVEYLTRCQYLLQRGIPVADVLYFYGENIPNTLARQEPRLPAGYDYDACNAEALLTRAAVKNGRIVLPEGTSYAVLLLAESDRMTPALLHKLEELVAAGATVVGRRPTRSPSLSGWPACDDEVGRIAAELWGGCDGRSVTEHPFGRGRVIWGMPLDSVLARHGGGADFAVADPGEFTAVHRRIGETEVYFVSSQNQTAAAATLRFRVKGMRPELWHPDSGRIARVARFGVDAAGTTVPVRFEPAGSVFVVFREPMGGVDPVVAVAREGEAGEQGAAVTLGPKGETLLTTDRPGSYKVTTAAGRSLSCIIGTVPAPLTIGDGWTLKFPTGWGAPAELAMGELRSWTENAEDAVRHFSGTATYVKEIAIPEAFFGEGREVWLDLGVVKEVAQVKLNGEDLGVLWKPPFRTKLGAAARPGRNLLEVRVTNLWPNRLIGDQKLPEKARYTWTTFNPFTADSPLRESGLLGPVRLTATVTVVAR